MKRIVALGLLTAVALWSQSAAVAQGTRTYKSKLMLMPLKLEVATQLTGQGTATAVLTGTKLSITGTYERFNSPATAAHVHRGAKGMRGPSVSDLKVTGGTSGTFSGDLTLTQMQADDLGRERFYITVSSEKSPEGLIWGWLSPQENAR